MQLVAAHLVEPRVRQPHRIEHPRGELGHARWWVALPRLSRHGLRHDAAQAVKVHEPVELAAEPGSAGREQNRVLEPSSEDVACESPGGH